MPYSLFGRSRLFPAFICAVLALSLTTGCAGGKKTSTLAGEEAVHRADREEREERLRAIMYDEIRGRQRHGGPGDARFIVRKPYRYKEYEVLPDGPDGFTIAFTETDSRTVPLTAEVELNRVRYATRFERNKDRAREDTAFQRGTGKETVSYELRNGRWRRLGSLFVSDSTEELRDGEWVQIKERPELFLDEPEEKRGWFSRLLFWR